MDANNGGVYHLRVAVMAFGDGVHEAVPHTCFTPSDKAIVAGGAGAVSLWQIAPLRTGSQHPEDAVQHAAIVYARQHLGQERLDHKPFGIGQVIAAHAEAESHSIAI